MFYPGKIVFGRQTCFIWVKTSEPDKRDLRTGLRPPPVDKSSNERQKEVVYKNASHLVNLPVKRVVHKGKEVGTRFSEVFVNVTEIKQDRDLQGVPEKLCLFPISPKIQKHTVGDVREQGSIN